MDAKQFEEMMKKAQATSPTPQPEEEAPQQGTDLNALANQFLQQGGPEVEPAAEAEGEGFSMDGMVRSVGEFLGADPNKQMPEEDIIETPEERLSKESAAGRAVAGAATGALQSVFETKDFLFGDTPPEQQSDFRQGMEEVGQAAKDSGLVGGFASGIGQFSAAMVGLGKVSSLAKMVPFAGRGFAAATEASKFATETAKAATAGAIAFDPHEERLSNLVQGTVLANPLNAWLAADPSDSSAEGRMKSAIESIGLDAALGVTLMGAVKVFKYLKSGNQSAASQAVDRLQEQQRAMVAQEMGEQSNAAGLGDVPPTSGDTGTPAMAAGDNPQAGNLAAGLPEAGGGVQPEALQAQPAGSLDEGRQGGPEVSPQAAPDADPTVTPELVSTPSDAAKADGVDLLGTPTKMQQPRITYSLEETDVILKQADDDFEAINKHGGWYAAQEAGHQFGKAELPYRMMNSDAEVDDFWARVVDAKQEQFDKLKGGKVISDAAQNRKLTNMAVAFGEDPAAILGAIQQAGKMGPELITRMETGYLLAGQALRDTFKLRQKYKIGDWVDYGGQDAMKAEIAKRFGIAGSLMAHSESLKSNFARGLRRMQFMNDYSKLKDMDLEKAMDLLDETGGDPKKFKHLTNPGLMQTLGDFALYMRVNSLVSGPKTQLINLMSNAYMVGARPLERMLGAVIPAVAGSKASRRVLRESLLQYSYMRTAFTDGFGLAAKAFLKNDSILSPHNVEMWQGSRGVTSVDISSKDAFAQGFRKWNSTSNLIYNALRVASVPLGMPTRSLGSVDELMKQTVYRSKLQAAAHVEAAEMAFDAGLTGKPAKDFIKSAVEKRVLEGFDKEGRGIDPRALHEAQLATFQQDLLPGTIGKGISTLTQNVLAARLILPFVKTPTNVIRYGWKMTPGLNLLQKEYRQMLTGKMGNTAAEVAEQQAQALGQMSMGALFMGTAAYLAADGHITGGGPRDPKLKQELLATGWKPYSYVTVNEDGTKTFTEFGRFDPVAIPFGIVADLQDAVHALDKAEENPEIEAAVGGLFIALAKQFTSKSYLLGVTQTLEALNDPETRMGSVGGNMVTSFIPYSAAMRQLNTDDYMREARTVADRVMATIPGLSENVPARYDAFGEPIVMRRGLWSSTDDANLDIEMQRLAIESGRAPVRVSPNIGGIDLRDVTMSNGKNAYEEYQKLTSQPTPGMTKLSKKVGDFINTESYKRAPDGDADVKGTKLWLLHKFTSKYRGAAFKKLKADPVIRDALLKESLKVRDAYRNITEEAPEPTRMEKIVTTLGGG